MSPETMHRIFEPFFTTKPIGRGTGLGLATVYGIVKQSEGWISVDSRPGQGAAFRIFLPVHIAAASAPTPPRPARPAARDLSGAGRILLVEDEDAVRSVAAKLLRARGYEVIEASSGEEALELAEAHAGEIDLMIGLSMTQPQDARHCVKREVIWARGKNTRFDPDGRYVRRWVPEIARLPDKWLHAPWTAPPMVLEASGLRLDRDYPAPIVAHEFARARALEAYARLRGR
jgi:CheY-like chemotaxis protein